MKKMESWANVLNGLYNSCLMAPCRGRDSPPLPNTPPERPPLPLIYTEYRYYDRRHGFQHSPATQNSSHHRAEWSRGVTTDRGNSGTAHGAIQQVFKRIQRSNQQSQQYQKNTVFSKAEAPNCQLYNNNIPRMHPKGQATQEWCNDQWPHDSESYLRIEMDSPNTATRVCHPVVDMLDSDAEYFTPRIAPRALRRQVTPPSQQKYTWARCELLEAPPLEATGGIYYHSLPSPRSKMVIPKPRRLCISPQGVKISVVEKPMSMRATITPTTPPNASPPSQRHFCPIQHHMVMQPSNRHQQSQGGAAASPQETRRLVHQPSPVKPRRHGRSSMAINKHALSKHRGESVNETSSGGLQRQVDVKLKNVFGQPLVLAALKPVQSPQLSRKSKIEEDLRSLLIMDNNIENHRKVANIDGSLYCEISPLDPLDVYAEDPRDLSHSPARSQPHIPPESEDISSSPQISRHGYGSVSELDESPVRDVKTPEEQARVASLDAPPTQGRGHLINGEGKMASICTSECQNNKTGTTAETMSHSPPDSTTLGDSEELTRQVHYLENILGELKSDLTNQERRGNLALLAEVEKLRQNNRRLLEESVCAYQELDKLRTVFSISPGHFK
ncbi:hypothetical protein ACEWY4_010026 [Coilia grayii]|uniref:Signal-induced proliferation-associated 1-like protein C-terminal domain-containing protein n=1 Tax=Coilia grayii TaxID=363190 RepID=A0ABD1K837_9TELE